MPSQTRITAEDRGPLVNLANWITLVVACLATLTKIATKLRKIRTLQGDDFIMFAAMVCSSVSYPSSLSLSLSLFFFFGKLYTNIQKPLEQLSAVGQSIAVGKQVSNGLGRHINTLTDSQIDEYQKASLTFSWEISRFWLSIIDRIHRRVALHINTLPSKIRRPAFSQYDCHWICPSQCTKDCCGCEFLLGADFHDCHCRAVCPSSTVGYHIG